MHTQYSKQNLRRLKETDILQVLFVREESTNKENIQTLQYKHIKDNNTLMSNSIMAYMKFHNITIVLL